MQTRLRQAIGTAYCISLYSGVSLPSCVRSQFSNRQEIRFVSNRNDVNKREVRTQQCVATSQTTIRPSVDIFEDETGLTVMADMPGVSKEGLDIQADNETLTIDGSTEISTPEDMDAVYVDVSATRYQRSFSLSSELDADKAEAMLKDGVLSLRIPKREQFKPRKIEVHTK
ncbi:MAG: Hsp20/alpha crystallin family protein [Candidatus Thiodiazotropha sp. (ex Lucinoma borealis)]|nr:Hsp20/alpha crystallin family protein [Candidatus Thiodiazotropha sp. (ex Lucinoma borealis)]